MTIYLLYRHKDIIRHRIGKWKRIWTVYITFFVALVLITPQLVTNPFPLDTSIGLRWRYMEIGSNLLIKEPLGNGIGNFAVVTPYAAHNWVVKLGSELGLLGLVIFALILGRTLDGLFQVHLKGDDKYAGALFASLLWFTIGGMGPSNVLMQSNIFWIILGLSITYVVLVRSSTQRVYTP
jgi:O-antigen ligase